MTVTLAANALLTLDQAKEFLGILGPEQDDTLIGQINRASDYCEWWTGRPLAARAFTTLRLAGQSLPKLYPPAIPIDVTKTITVSVDGVAQTVWRTEADGDPALKDVIVGADMPGEPSHLYRECGWRGCTPYPVLLSYTGGFDPIPGELVEVAQEVLRNIRRSADGLADVQAFGAGPVAAGGVTFRADLIPMRAKQILDAYRLVCV